MTPKPTYVLPLALAAALTAFAPAWAAAPQEAVATFAGGCFWSVEKAFDGLPGVKSATSGYAGGTVPNPSYEQVTGGSTGHAEAVRVVFDPAKVTYAKLLDRFWHTIDPLTANAQFCDHGPQYRTAVFWHDAAQRDLATRTKAALQKRFGRPVATEVLEAGPFYAAEAYHQDFAARNPARYGLYRMGCGRDQRLEAIWGDAAGH